MGRDAFDEFECLKIYLLVCGTYFECFCDTSKFNVEPQWHHFSSPYLDGWMGLNSRDGGNSRGWDDLDIVHQRHWVPSKNLIRPIAHSLEVRASACLKSQVRVGCQEANFIAVQLSVLKVTWSLKWEWVTKLPSFFCSTSISGASSRMLPSPPCLRCWCFCVKLI